MALDEQTLNIEGHPLRNPFWRELDEGLITYRDNLQFELKSEFYINPNVQTNIYTQECYIFIPETLQINYHTYSSKDFYLDQTNLIRYKTPFLTFEELLNPANEYSPLSRLQTLQDKDKILREFQLTGNIFRSTLRVRVRRLLKQLTLTESPTSPAWLSEQIITLCQEIEQVRTKFQKISESFSERFEPNHFEKQLAYVDEFMSDVIEEYLTLFLDFLRKKKLPNITQAEQAIHTLLEKEKKYRETHKLFSPNLADTEPAKESILYRQGMIEKFMLSVLKLKNTRVQLREKHAQFIGAMAAGVAMLVYTILFVWGSTNFVINSVPFLTLAVVFYILKDRIKEGMKTYYQRKASLWFPDYSTEIHSPSGEIIGKLNESFGFINSPKLPEGLHELRFKDDSDELEAYQPEETIMHYKKEVLLQHPQGQLNELNTIFRYNIHRFLEKANDPVQPTFSPDLQQLLLPKVYHINIILRNTYQDRDLRSCTETKKFRVVIDKEGIRRVEHIYSEFTCV